MIKSPIFILLLFLIGDIGATNWWGYKSICVSSCWVDYGALGSVGYVECTIEETLRNGTWDIKVSVLEYWWDCGGGSWGNR